MLAVSSQVFFSIAIIFLIGIVSIIYRKNKIYRTKISDAFKRSIFLQKKAETNLVIAENATQVAEAANDAKTQFLANMSHEIRTPAGAVIGLTNLLLTTKLDDKQTALVNTLKSSSEALLSLINAVLDITKIEAGEIDVEEIAFSPHALIAQITDIASVKADEKGIGISISSPVKEEQFVGDSHKIIQILLNLVNNAVKFTEQGEVKVQLDIPAYANEEGIKKINFAVIDSGIGIEKKQLDKIFEKFSQADSSIVRKYGGTGLGLAISKALAEKMGGTIAVSSVPGIGSIFTLSLPLKTMSLSLRVNKSEKSDWIGSIDKIANSQKLPVLLVDDYPANILIAASFLELLGYTYETAANGQQAEDKYEPGKYSVILMDIEMPVLNGYDTTRSIRQRELFNGWPHQPIIGITANILHNESKKCLKAGMDDYITKPVEQSILHAKLLQHTSDNNIAHID